jgi:hypothetical protein
MRVRRVFAIAILCASTGLGIAALKIARLGLPLSASASATVWEVEARVAFEGTGKAARIALGLPQAPRGFTVLDESFVSRGFGLTVQAAPETPRQAIWTQRRASGGQALYYHLKVLPKSETPRKPGTPPAAPPTPEFTEPLALAVAALVAGARHGVADQNGFVSALIAQIQRGTDDDARLVRRAIPDGDWPHFATRILASAGLASRVVWGLALEGDFADRDLMPWLEVHTGERWTGFDPERGTAGWPTSFLVWTHDDPALIEASGVRRAQVAFSGTKTPTPQLAVPHRNPSRLDAALRALSLFDLPVRTQNVYRVLLMVPIGALVIVVMRTVVGIPTFGTFMPVLVALAFRETRLAWGVALFLIVVSLGLLIRVGFTRLRLLLVPRLASVLVIVIGLMLGVSLVSARIGFEPGLSIALFPMVILTMTIERMSIVWDERGGATAVKECAGSLFVAICGYFAMTEPHFGYLMFVFPELLLVALAACLLFGAYTGYRLSELLRFRDLVRDPP